MKRKLILLGTILTAIVLITPRLIVFTYGVRDYYRTNADCYDVISQAYIASPDSQLPTTMLVYEVKPYTVLTDRGLMFPGDEYQAYGEGAWYGMATLLFVGKNGATFLVNYPVNDPVQGHSRLNCRALIPVGDWR